MARPTWDDRFQALYEFCGSHQAVARALNISGRHYARLRSQPELIHGATERLLIILHRLVSMSASYRQIKQNIDQLVMTELHAGNRYN